MKEFQVQKKDEAYSYDELDFLNMAVSLKAENTETLKQKIGELKSAIYNDKENQAVFFMPETTFSIFSMIQGDNSICEITKEDLEVLSEIVEAFDKSTNSSDFSEKFKNHMEKKLIVLKEFLTAGNKVKPVSIQVSEFEIM